MAKKTKTSKKEAKNTKTKSTDKDVVIDHKKTVQEKMELDFIGKGFRKIDSKHLKIHPPKIKWGDAYERQDDKSKIKYLEKLAATMNHAAALVQDERDQLTKLCELKEKQIEALKRAMEANEQMVHSEINKMNEERQLFNASRSGLKGDALKEQLKKWQEQAE